MMELYFGAFNKRELGKIKSRMKHLETLILDRSITPDMLQEMDTDGMDDPDLLQQVGRIIG